MPEYSISAECQTCLRSPVVDNVRAADPDAALVAALEEVNKEILAEGCTCRARNYMIAATLVREI